MKIERFVVKESTKHYGFSVVEYYCKNGVDVREYIMDTVLSFLEQMPEHADFVLRPTLKEGV